MQHDLITTEKRERKGYLKTVLIVIAILLAMAILVLNVFTHLLSVVSYYGDGMEPNLSSGKTLLVSKTADISEGDVIAFYYNNKVLVRRVICSGGKQISIDREGTVTINGTVLDEPYLEGKSIGLCNIEFPYYVTPDHMFVMGDNRAISMDSRLAEIGVISQDRIIGKVLFVK